MNRVCLVGRATAPVEIQKLPSGDRVAKIRLAVYQGKESSGFYTCVAFGKSVDFVENLTKGEQIALEGKLHQKTFKRKDGSTGMEVLIYVDNFSYLGKKPAPLIPVEVQDGIEDLSKDTIEVKKAPDPFTFDNAPDDLPF